MKKSLAAGSVLLMLLIVLVTAGIGCDSVRGGANVYLEGVSLGPLYQDGKPIQGLPTGKVDIVLKVSTDEVHVSSSDDGAIITLSPSGATITAGPDGMTITGVEPDQVEMKWREPE
jgi:hypothetical protein